MRDHPQNSKINKKRDDKRDSDDRLRDPPGLEEFTDDLEDTELLAPAHISQDSDSERPTKVVFKIKDAQYLYSLRIRPKVRSLLANQNDKGSLLKTQWRSSTSSRNVW